MQLGLQRRRTLLALTLLVLTLAGLGSGYLWDQYRDATKLDARFQLTIFRSGMSVVQDVGRLRSVVARMAATAQNLEDIEDRTKQALSETGKSSERETAKLKQLRAILEQDRFALSEALDFLFVRGYDYLRLLERVPKLAEDMIVTRALMEELIAMCDTALNAESPSWPELQTVGQPLMTDLSSQVVSFGELQYQVQSRAVGTQTRALELLIVASMAFLWFFAFATIGAVFVLRSEVLARFQRQEAEDKAQFLAYYDTLTGLPNRARFSDAALELFAGNEAPVVLLFDLDDFKAINDLYGHAAGDALLMRVAQVLRETMEANHGVCARLGGDEFAAVLPGPMSSIKIAAVCERLIAQIRAPFFHETVQLSGKVSIGIAQHPPAQGEAALGDMQKAADTALYRAKSAGKNTYAFYDSELADLAARRREVEAGITAALENDGFTIVLQPLVHLNTGEIYGFESLTRLSIDGVAISPGEFISIAESTGQVVELDLWGFESAARQFALWHKENVTTARLSCNLSSLHFKSDEIVGRVKDVLERTGLDPGKLTLELTESMMLEDVEKVTAILERLRQMGIAIALDDFGTGYSSLSYLRRLSVDIIKIDQSFVRGLHEGVGVRCILEAIVDIANGLGKKLVVEGIETEEELQIMRSLNCDIGQGYLFGRPMEIGLVEERFFAQNAATG